MGTGYRPTRAGYLLAGGSRSTIGDTPIVELRVVVCGIAHRVLLKLESANGGGGSIKARTARSLLDDGAARGVIRHGSTIVESSSGNLAVALAIQGRARGYEVIVVLDPLTTEINVAKVRAAGAQIEMVETPDANGGYLRARQLRLAALRRERGAWWPNQYQSPANPAAHRHGTGAEICAAVPEADAIFVATSTGGTIGGIAQAVLDADCAALVVPVDVPGSHALATGHGKRLLPGVGSPDASIFVEAAERDHALFIPDEYGIAASRDLADQTGVSVGGSSGLAFVAALRWLIDRPPSVVVVVCADAASNYDFSDSAMLRRGIDLPSLADFVDDYCIAEANASSRRRGRAPRRVRAPRTPRRVWP
jgi:N-(2-amino-2-carboxyethyl)-L-glutamate synthase